MKVKHTEDDVSTDGGEPRKMFDESEVTEVTRSQRVSRTIQESFVTPAKIAWSDWRTRLGILILGVIGFFGVFTWIYQLQSPDNPTTSWDPSDALINKPFEWLGVGWRMHEPSSAVDPWGRLAGTGVENGPFDTMLNPLGHTPQGRDMLAEVLWATPFMLKMVVAGGLFTIGMATLVGTVAGYKGGRTETVLMTASDIAMSIPGLPLVAVLVAAIPTGNPYALGIIITANVWAGLGRTIHSQVLSLREQSYVEASRTMGIGSPTILRKDILPNLMPYIAVNVTYAARRVIYDSVALYYLGILTAGQTNWGKMMREAVDQGAMTSQFYTLAIPMIPIVLLSLGLILFAQGTDRLFNPRVRTRHEGETQAEDHEGDDNVQVGI